MQPFQLQVQQHLDCCCYKGYLIGITGRLQHRTYDTAEGEHRYVTEVVADKVEFLSKPKGAVEEPTETKKSKSKKAS